jgi:uncharacterized OB-fold protein
MTVIERPEGSPERFSPPISPAAEPFWEATREQRFVLQWCPACEQPVHFPREACPRCLGAELEFRPASGLGTVYAVSVMPKASNPTMAGRAPYAVALVDLDEGARMLTNVVDVDPETVVVGQRVQVAWEPLADGRHLAVFVPVSSP